MGNLKAALTALFNSNNYTPSTSGITSKKIPVTETSGLPSGQISMDNLASVLGSWLFGGMATSLTTGDDVFQLERGSYMASSAVNESLVNRPSTMSTAHTCRIFVMQQTNTNSYKTIIIICSWHVFICYLYTMNGSLTTDGWKEITSSPVSV